MDFKKLLAFMKNDPTQSTQALQKEIIQLRLYISDYKTNLDKNIHYAQTVKCSDGDRASLWERIERTEKIYHFLEAAVSEKEKKLSEIPEAFSNNDWKRLELEEKIKSLKQKILINTKMLDSDVKFYITSFLEVFPVPSKIGIQNENKALTIELQTAEAELTHLLEIPDQPRPEGPSEEGPGKGPT